MIIPLVVILPVLALLYKIRIWRTKRKLENPPTTSLQGHPMISYLQLVRATEGFSTSKAICLVLAHLGLCTKGSSKQVKQ
jgi:hypothetical protein